MARALKADIFEAFKLEDIDMLTPEIAEAAVIAVKAVGEWLSDPDVWEAITEATDGAFEDHEDPFNTVYTACMALKKVIEV